MKDAQHSRRTKFEVESKKSIELQHLKTKDANKSILDHKLKVSSLKQKN